MKKGNVVKWKNSGDFGCVIAIEGDYAKLRYKLVYDDHMKHKISDWIPISELEIIQEYN